MRTADEWSHRQTHSGAEAPQRFAALSELFDPGTIRYLLRCGVGRGWRCLEVGGGGGSVASWLADQVGSDGEVVVTDVDTTFLEKLVRPGLTVLRHDIARDPLPLRSFDLIHVRLVLIHLAERDAILQRLVTALTPGGWLVVEEFDSESMPPDPSACPDESLLKAHVGMARAMVDRGVDRRYGRRVFARLRRLGLQRVGAEARVFMVQGGSPGAALFRASCERLRRDMIAAGYVSAQEFADDMVRVDDPELLMPSPAMWATWGRRGGSREIDTSPRESKQCADSSSL
jgi:SAM-dependent methyltransferase